MVSVNIVQFSLRSLDCSISLLYRLDSGRIACLTPCCVVDFRVVLALSMPIFHFCVSYSAVTFVCLSLEMTSQTVALSKIAAILSTISLPWSSLVFSMFGGCVRILLPFCRASISPCKSLNKTVTTYPIHYSLYAKNHFCY
jgi:hypothetical protein